MVKSPFAQESSNHYPAGRLAVEGVRRERLDALWSLALLGAVERLVGYVVDIYIYIYIEIQNIIYVYVCIYINIYI